MDTYFADTFYYRALFDPRDSHHDRVVKWTQGRRYRTITTDFVLAELGDEFSRPSLRSTFMSIIDDLRRDSLVEVIDATRDWIDQGITHFGKYEDKEWGVTDCMSFLVMSSRGLHGALTGDHHFEQAGFVALLR